ncbi:beta-lactamase family protein [Pochonia chlamydosporia 170]|uniref:Beta-lactamase family protein n=1 Tax=Pochonia chlamydosporia 170 TaxID=1380566 RepID=A0A179F067_METCM|nr:beta-lactamase family protein [Pochonia chlamydosporia 170]OAQ58493.1 beta-lactamase family protein [Pochonia chlamydosporia 170]
MDNKTTTSFNLVKDQIGQIRKQFRTPSISCGVLHDGEVIFRHCEGFANVENSLQPDADTLYLIASCTKAFTSATCAILENEGNLNWAAPVSLYLPDFNTVHDPEIGKRATLEDLLSHSTGLAPVDHAVTGFYDEYYNKGHDQVKIASYLPVAYNFRSRWLYKHTIYGVVGELIAKITGKSAGQAMKKKVFELLGMKRTCTSAKEYTDNNVATGYSILDGGTALPLENPQLEDGGIQGAAGFARSSVNDMLLWAKAVMEAEDEAKKRGKSPGLPGIEFARCAHRPMTLENELGENSYGFGWFRHTLPSRWLSTIGPNFALLPDPPIIGADSCPRLAVAHWGEFQGFLTPFYTFPETKSAVIVMANSSPSRGDPTDLIAQALCQELFDMKPRISLYDAAVRASTRANERWSELVQEWATKRDQTSTSQPASEFVGNFSNTGLMLDISIRELSDQEKGHGERPELLEFTVNDMPRQRAKLRYYHHDVWTFIPDSRDDATRRGLEQYMLLPLLLFSFLRNAEGKVVALEWDLQAGVAEGPAPGLSENVQPIRFDRVEK